MIDERSTAPLRAVFLDIGDTVMRPNPSWEGVYAIALAEYGIDVEMDTLRTALRRAYHHGGFGFDDRFEATEATSFARTVEIDSAALAELGLDPMPESFFRRLSELFMLPSSWHVFPDAAPALVALRSRGLRVAAVSNWVWQLPDLLDALNLVSHLDFIAASARVGFQKPHPGIFLWALEQARVQAGEAIHVGDHLDADVEGARRAGISPVLIDRRDRFGPTDLPNGTPLIRNLAELIPIVDARLAAPVAGQ